MIIIRSFSSLTSSLPSSFPYLLHSSPPQEPLNLPTLVPHLLHLFSLLATFLPLSLHLCSQTWMFWRLWTSLRISRMQEKSLEEAGERKKQSGLQWMKLTTLENSLEWMKHSTWTHLFPSFSYSLLSFLPPFFINFQPHSWIHEKTKFLTLLLSPYSRTLIEKFI